jgi:hypothetical protein
VTVLPRNGGCFLLLFRGLHWRREGAPVPPVARGLVVLASGHDDHRERQIRTSGASTSVAPICQSGCQPLMNYGKPIIAPTRVAANPVLPTGTCPASQNAHDRADRKGDAPGCRGHQKNRGSATQCNRPQTAAMCQWDVQGFAQEDKGLMPGLLRGGFAVRQDRRAKSAGRARH